ncbi:3-deoxy-D-manno-octulosonic acid transferase [Xenophilus arseniciresistens]|uniref:3-deoxy-D-manno-octulosonic acid transferase n=1 Tax=Xenophilus arseniciresistens TaxID=1283306 RepID=A0AAE3N4A1_9BURK|nr:3-deoxy-D-manno-octulosonic acid transferase [Xenophilus arseniciresistens]MDA7414976.1 3-deoxy-D-manno-octulosonic acid transferase [Xenophilus arseniciresistens]
MAQPLLRRKLRRRARAEPGYGVAVEERFGLYDPALSGTDWCWIHAVSLGETRAAGILIAQLRRQLPGVPILLTHGTATGREEGAKLLEEGDLQVWQPWDTPEAVARFLDRFRPRVGVLMETEVWPELTAACAERGIPLTLANARLNARSLARAERLAWLSRPAYASLAAVWAQSEADAHRLVSLGAKLGGVFGNLKFDAAPDARQLAHAEALRARIDRPVVVLASSREGEERQLLEAIKHYWVVAPSETLRGAPRGAPRLRACDVQWMIVPRHPQRFDEVAALIESAGFACARRSTADGTPRENEVWLGDSLGEMALYYGMAQVALLGGSFEPLGGQNLIEAAACGCPLILGPSTFNFAEAAELALDGGAAMRVDDMRQAVAHALALVADWSRHAGMAQAAQVFSGAHRGAAERTVTALLHLVQQRPDPAVPPVPAPVLGAEPIEPTVAQEEEVAQGRDVEGQAAYAPVQPAQGHTQRIEPRLD